MHKTLSGKGYIQGGEGFLIVSTGERYSYHDGELTQMSVRPWPISEPTATKPNYNKSEE